MTGMICLPVHTYVRVCHDTQNCACWRRISANDPLITIRACKMNNIVNEKVNLIALLNCIYLFYGSIINNNYSVMQNDCKHLQNYEVRVKYFNTLQLNGIFQPLPTTALLTTCNFCGKTRPENISCFKHVEGCLIQ